MSLINVSEIVTDPDFAQSFFVHRTIGDWTDGGYFVGDTQKLVFYGVIEQEKTKEKAPTMQADPLTGNIFIWTLQPIFTTQLSRGASPNRQSDEVEWLGDRYKVVSVENRVDWGYYHAIATYKRSA